MYLPLGFEAEDAIRKKAAKVVGVVDEWKDVIRDTRIDEPESGKL